MLCAGMAGAVSPSDRWPGSWCGRPSTSIAAGRPRLSRPPNAGQRPITRTSNSLASSGARSKRRFSTRKVNGGCGLGQRVGGLRTSAQCLLRLIRQHQPPAPPARSNSCPRGISTCWKNRHERSRNSPSAATNSGWSNGSTFNPRGRLIRPCLPSSLPHDHNSNIRRHDERPYSTGLQFPNTGFAHRRGSKSETASGSRCASLFRIFPSKRALRRVVDSRRGRLQRIVARCCSSRSSAQSTGPQGV